MPMFRNLAVTNLLADVMQGKQFKVGTDIAGAVTCDSSYYGKIHFVNGGTTNAITLPANGAAAGSWMIFINSGADTVIPTYSAAAADTLITFNDQQADSVTFGSGHRIGSAVLFISTGTYWACVNLGNHTMTVATS